MRDVRKKRKGCQKKQKDDISQCCKMRPKCELFSNFSLNEKH